MKGWPKKDKLMVFGFLVVIIIIIIQQDPAYDIVASKVLLPMLQAPRSKARGHDEANKAPAILQKNKNTSTRRMAAGGQNNLKLLSKKNQQSPETLPPICCQSNRTQLEISKITLWIREETHA